MTTETRMSVKKGEFQTLAEWYLIPGIIVTTVVSNQLTWSLGPSIGRILGWSVILCASVIVTSRFPGRLWPLILIVLIFISKVFQSLFGAEAKGVTPGLYMVLYGLLMSITGIIMMTTRLNLVYKQLYYICLLNVVFMFLQVAGIADWTQFAATETQSETVNYPIAFFNNTDDFDGSQARPTGLLYANQYLAIIALLGLVVHFSRKGGRFKTGTLVMCAMAVLSMAKLVLFGFILISLFVMIAGTNYQRWSILRGFALTVLLVYLYGRLFPGLFEHNLNIGQLIFSFSTRISSVLHGYGNDDSLRMLQDISDTYRSDTVNIKVLHPIEWAEMEWAEDTRISGYIDLVGILPFVVPAILATVPFYIMGFLKLRNRFPDLTTLATMSMLIALLIPSVGPLWRQPIYLFICGFALFPLFILFSPGAFQTPEDGLRYLARKKQR